jgi:manganese/zinc/iron transport system substrate-binding protein
MRRRLARPVAAAVALLLAAVVAAGCGVSGESGASEIGDRKIRVTTTTNFITDTARRIGGDRVEVTGLMGPGVDPHLYKASASDVRAMREADVILYGGLQLEGKMADLFDDLAERQTTVAVTKDLPREELLAPAPGAVEQYDPHVWFDIGKWQIAARTVAETFKAKDPRHAEVYDRNLRRFSRELERLDRYVRERMREIPERRRLLVTSHDAFEYFGERYDVEVAAIQGISTAAEATTADVQRIARLLAERDVRAVFVESSVPRQTIEAVLAAARQLGHEAEIGGELYADAAGSEGTPEGSYVGMIRANADTIAEGLR